MAGINSSCTCRWMKESMWTWTSGFFFWTLRVFFFEWPTTKIKDFYPWAAPFYPTPREKLKRNKNVVKIIHVTLWLRHSVREESQWISMKISCASSRCRPVLSWSDFTAVPLLHHLIIISILNLWIAAIIAPQGPTPEVSLCRFHPIFPQSPVQPAPAALM